MLLAPWLSYLALIGNNAVGICSFKGPPKDNKVEIAYFTFPDYQGKGIASLMVERLLSIAYSNRPGLVVSARTLSERNASHRVLEKCGFAKSGVIDDREDAKVLEWFHHAQEP